jgi:hypothetical protein
LLPGQSTTSPDGQVKLIFQEGQLILSDVQNKNTQLWNSGNGTFSGGKAVMQPDGNLVIYNGSGQAKFYTDTYKYPGSILSVQDDGNMVIYDKSNAVWATDTHVQYILKHGDTWKYASKDWGICTIKFIDGALTVHSSNKRKHWKCCSAKDTKSLLVHQHTINILWDDKVYYSARLETDDHIVVNDTFNLYFYGSHY